MRLVLGAFLRPEQKFDSFPMLVAQVLVCECFEMVYACSKRHRRFFGICDIFFGLA